MDWSNWLTSEEVANALRRIGNDARWVAFNEAQELWQKHFHTNPVPRWEA